jgi:hypothetical protein
MSIILLGDDEIGRTQGGVVEMTNAYTIYSQNLKA